MSTFKSEGKEKWAQLIGNTLIDFGDIELITYWGLKRFPTEDIFPSVKGLMLGKRIDLLTSVLESKFGDKANKMNSLLGRVKHLSKSRNLIAHNTLSLDVYEDENGKISGLMEVVQSAVENEKYLHYE